MKKIFTNLCIYTVILGIIAFFLGFFGLEMAPVMPGAQIIYRARNGLGALFTLLPSIMFTGFLLGTSIYFGTVKNPSKIRFSHTVISCFKAVMVIAIMITVVLTLVHDILLPQNRIQKIEMTQRPRLLKEYLNLSEEYLEKAKTKPAQARMSEFYAKKALEIDRKNVRAAQLIRLAEIAGAQVIVDDHVLTSIEQNHANGIQPGVMDDNSPIDTSEIFRMKSSSVLDLINEGERLFEAGDYLGAHYYAQSAVQIADGKDINLATAKDLAARAWNVLSNSQEEKPTEANLFFRQKFKGYQALTSGNFLSAYYIFQGLNNQKLEYARDPDVIRYLNISRWQLTQEYFFTDETDDKDSFESAKNVYFSIKHSDGSYDIIFINGITDINNTGNLVRYLRGLFIFSFNSSGSFLQSVYTPYAKMLAVSASEISPEKLNELHVNPEWTTIPYVMLHSLDRNREEVHVMPVYLDKDKNAFTGPNQALLSMPYTDFDIIVKCSGNTKTMNLWNIGKLKAAADYYGYSQEIILQSVMTSIFYPFILLILLVFIAVLGWNYRLKEGTVFKFTWLFIILIFNIMFYPVVLFCEYSIKLLNYIFIGVAGQVMAIPLGCACYTIALLLVSILFLSRKGD